VSENTVNETEVVAEAAAVETALVDTTNEPREARRGGRERNPNKDRNRDRDAEKSQFLERVVTLHHPAPSAG